MTLLKQKVLTAILRRLDITLFQKLVQGDHLVKPVSAPERLTSKRSANVSAACVRRVGCCTPPARCC